MRQHHADHRAERPAAVDLRRLGAYQPQPGWRRFAMQTGAALTVLALVLWFAMGSETLWLEAPTLTRITRLTLVVLAGMAAYFATLFACGLRMRDFRRRAAE